MKDFKYFIIHKPYRILSQYTGESGHKGLGDVFEIPPRVYPVGRLDLDSEGLLLLTDDTRLNHLLLHPTFAHLRTYWVEVEGKPTKTQLIQLGNGVSIKINGQSHLTAPAEVQLLSQTDIAKIPPRTPSVNYTKHPQTSWLSLILKEGKNRQVRRMTAAIGHPTLRLIRVGIENLQLWPLQAGQMIRISPNLLHSKLGIYSK